MVRDKTVSGFAVDGRTGNDGNEGDGLRWEEIEVATSLGNGLFSPELSASIADILKGLPTDLSSDLPSHLPNADCDEPIIVHHDDANRDDAVREARQFE